MCDNDTDLKQMQRLLLPPLGTAIAALDLLS